MQPLTLFATTPKAMETILAEEIQALGGLNIRQTMAGVAFNADLETAYRICLWSRTANRVLLNLADFEVQTQQDLYQGVQGINWSDHMEADGSLAVTFSAKHTQVFTNNHFGALKVKDAIVDQLRERDGRRPDIDTQRPSIRVSVYLQGKKAQLALDLSGESLHKRGYRDVSVAAPIKENLAAAILIRSGWPSIAEQNGTLLDPMCGSGTLLLEAAMMAADYAPGLQREYYGFLGWKQHQAKIWRQLMDDAEQRKQAGMERLPVIAGFDSNRRTIAAAFKHVENAGFAGKVHVEKRELGDAESAQSWSPGLLVCNPPYGERLGDEEQTAALYQRFGDILKHRFKGWKAALIISNPELGFRLGIRSKKPLTLYNGALECKLLRMDVEEKAFFIPKGQNREENIQRIQQIQADNRAEMFANRLNKNLKKWSKWAKRQGIECYRLYDADLPEYAVAVDVYQSDQLWVNVQEYEPPKSVDEQKADQRLAALLMEIPAVLNVEPEQVVLKIRRKQKNTLQYEKMAEQGRFHQVNELGCLFWVNLQDYLDTGLFLDHRPIRSLIQQQAKGKRFLNLFAYTGAATVHAIKGGALASTTVDMSNTYLEWAQKNFNLNKVSGDHKLVKADCTEWLKAQAGDKKAPRYDLIFLDPPTFSNSKSMESAFDVQTDHVDLIGNATALLNTGGVLYFSTNYRRFKMDEEALSHLQIEDISSSTIPEDFARNPRIHYCWKISL